FRMAKFGRGRMPHLGSEFPDWQGSGLIELWISELEHPTPPRIVRRVADGVEQQLSSPTTALPFAQAVGLGSLIQGEPDKVLAAAGKLPPGPVRDLFEGYLPPDPKGRRLGSNPRPGGILGLTGAATPAQPPPSPHA